MNTKVTATVAAVVVVAVLFAGWATAQPQPWMMRNYAQYPGIAEFHSEMAELHQQYASGEITAEEFWTRMSEEHAEHFDEMPCHGGTNGMMGFGTRVALN